MKMHQNTSMSALPASSNTLSSPSLLSPTPACVAVSPFRHHRKLLLYLLLAMPWISTGTIGVKVHSVVVPDPGVSGEDIQLDCKWSTGVKGFYAVRWYKDGEQFYSYIPDNNPQKVDHNLPGVNVMLVSSDQNSVTLRKIDLSSEGTYRCEVMSEGPTFEIDFTSANLTVVEMPKRPLLTGLQKSYSETDTLRLNCTVENSRPPADISFHINGIPTQAGRVRSLPTTTDREDGSPYTLSTTSKELILPLSKKHLKGIMVMCQAKVYKLSIQESGFADVRPKPTTFSFFNAGVPRVCPPTILIIVISAALTHLLNT